MPGDLVGIHLGIEGQLKIPLAANPLRPAKRHDRSRTVSGPLEGFAVVRHPQVINFSLLDQSQGFFDGVGRHGVEGADLVILAPRPPALALGPAFDRGRFFGLRRPAG